MWVGSSGDMELISYARAIKGRAFLGIGERRSILVGRETETAANQRASSLGWQNPQHTEQSGQRRSRATSALGLVATLPQPQAVLPGERHTYMKIGHVRRFPRLRVDMDSRGRQKSP